MAVLVRPMITEKSIQDAGMSKFTFVVLPSATKTQIKAEVQDLFGVHVLGVQTVTIKGRTLRTGKQRREKMAPTFKKAIVTVKKGETISYFEQNA